MKKNVPFFLWLMAAFLMNVAPPVLAFAESPLLNEAITLREQGALSKAESILKALLAQDPSLPEYHYELANVYASQYDRHSGRANDPVAHRILVQAAGELEQAAMIDPTFVAAQYNLGIVYKKLGEYEKAREQFKKVLVLDPDSVAARMQIGAIYEEQGFFDEARDAYLEAKEFDFGNPDIQSALADLEAAEDEFHLRQESARARELAFPRRDFRFSAFSHASDYEMERRQQIQSRGGAVQAVPYLAAMLVEQLMQSRFLRKDSES